LADAWMTATEALSRGISITSRQRYANPGLSRCCANVISVEGGGIKRPIPEAIERRALRDMLFTKENGIGESIGNLGKSDRVPGTIRVRPTVKCPVGVVWNIKPIIQSSKRIARTGNVVA